MLHAECNACDACMQCAVCRVPCALCCVLKLAVRDLMQLVQLGLQVVLHRSEPSQHGSGQSQAHAQGMQHAVHYRRPHGGHVGAGHARARGLIMSSMDVRHARARALMMSFSSSSMMVSSAEKMKAT